MPRRQRLIRCESYAWLLNTTEVRTVRPHRFEPHHLTMPIVPHTSNGGAHTIYLYMDPRRTLNAMPRGNFNTEHYREMVGHDRVRWADNDARDWAQISHKEPLRVPCDGATRVCLRSRVGSTSPRTEHEAAC